MVHQRPCELTVMDPRSGEDVALRCVFVFCSINVLRVPKGKRFSTLRMLGCFSVEGCFHDAKGKRLMFHVKHLDYNQV